MCLLQSSSNKTIVLEINSTLHLVHCLNMPSLKMEKSYIFILFVIKLEDNSLKIICKNTFLILSSL